VSLVYSRMSPAEYREPNASPSRVVKTYSALVRVNALTTDVAPVDSSHFGGLPTSRPSRPSNDPTLADGVLDRLVHNAQGASSKNTSSISVPRALANALAEPRIAKPHFSRTRMEATLSLAALA